MAKSSINRYSPYTQGQEIKVFHFVKVPKLPTDQFIEYKVGVTRLDKVSFQYYGRVDLDWFILQANPEYSLQADIEDGTFIRIPYPLDMALKKYNEEAEKIK